MPGPIRTVRSTQGVELALHELGGRGRALLLAHATGFCGPVWGPVAAALPDASSWALDFRCHGRSTRPLDDDLSWSGMADDVLAAVDAIGAEEVVAAGHSMGGAALLLAEQRRPGTFAALWCFEPIVMPPLPDGGDVGDNQLAAGAARRRAEFPSAQAAYDNFAGKPPLDVFRPDALAAYVAGGFEERPDGSVQLRCRPADESRCYLMGGRHDAFDHLGEIDIPVTVVRGRVEPGPALLAGPVAERLPRGLLQEMPGVGHFGPMEDPDGVAASIRAALW